ncbi:hypothetical protein ABK040_014034 [Willaertia magna]
MPCKRSSANASNSLCCIRDCSKVSSIRNFSCLQGEWQIKLEYANHPKIESLKICTSHYNEDLRLHPRIGGQGNNHHTTRKSNLQKKRIQDERKRLNLELLTSTMNKSLAMQSKAQLFETSSNMLSPPVSSTTPFSVVSVNNEHVVSIIPSEHVLIESGNIKSNHLQDYINSMSLSSPIDVNQEGISSEQQLSPVVHLVDSSTVQSFSLSPTIDLTPKRELEQVACSTTIITSDCCYSNLPETSPNHEACWCSISGDNGASLPSSSSASTTSSCSGNSLKKRKTNHSRVSSNTLLSFSSLGLIYNLSNEPSISYNLVAIREIVLHFEYLLNSVLYLENEHSRYELCKIDQVDSADSLLPFPNGFNARYKLSQVKNPQLLDREESERVGIPLKDEHLQQVYFDDLHWNEIEWGLASVSCRKKEFKLTSFFRLSLSKKQ